MTVKASDVPFNEALLRLCAVHQKKVAFRYAKGDGKNIESREFVPSQVRKTKDGHVSFLGYDEDRQGVRQFRTDRIKGEVRVA